MTNREDIIIPERYDIYRQDLSKDYLELQYMGFVHTIAEARTMCKSFCEADKEAMSGKATYIFKLS